MNMMYTLGQQKKKIHMDSLSSLAICHCYTAVISMLLTVPNTSVQAEVIEERVNLGCSYGLEIPVSYHFYGHERGSTGSRTDYRQLTKISKRT